METDLKEVANTPDYPSLSQWLRDYCESIGQTCWHNYGPADYGAYQSDTLKVMLMGSESGGYEGCKEVPSDEYLKWIRGGYKTPRYSSVLISFIREYVRLLACDQALPSFDSSAFTERYYDVDRLLADMTATAYMNARITSNDTGHVNEEKGAVMDEVRRFTPYRKRFIEILAPQVIVCGGSSAKEALFVAGGPFEPETFEGSGVFAVGGTIIVSTPHLGRPSTFGGYEALYKLACDCASATSGPKASR